MADLTLTPSWETGIYRIETTDQVIGGEDGISNIGIKQLGNRTEYLKEHVDALEDLDLETQLLNLNRIKGGATLLKHAIVSCKHTNGLPTYIDYIDGTPPTIPNTVNVYASASEPLILSFSGGYDADGPILYYGRVIADEVLQYGNNNNYLVVAKLNTTTGAITIELVDYFAPSYSYNAPSGPSTFQYWYSLRDEAMYQWSGSAWVKVYHVILGFASQSGGGQMIKPKHIGIDPMTLFGKGPVPAGTVHTFAGAIAGLPSGYLLADGSAISRTTYADLFAAVSTTYGVGDGSTTFNIPDLRGEFIRGLDNSRGIDTGRALGSAQADMFEAHTHVQQYTASSGPDDGYSIDGSNNPASQIATSVITGSTGGSETRPRNIAMNFIIKF